jgi:hypothetical protein
VRDGSGDRSGSGSDSAGGQVNPGGNGSDNGAGDGSDNGSGTRIECSPPPERKLFANTEAAETSPSLEDKREEEEEPQGEEMPERGVDDLLQNMGAEDVSRREPMRERGGDAGAGQRVEPEAEGSPSRDSAKAADLIGNFVGEEKQVEMPVPKGGVASQQVERVEDGGSRVAMPGLELSLKRGRSSGDGSEEGQPPSKQQLRTLRQSGGSAFSRYSMGGAMTNSSRQSQNQPQPSQPLGGYSSGPIGPPQSNMGSFMPPEFQMPSAFQMPTHLLTPDFSNPRTVEAGPELQGPSRLGSGEISSAAKRQTGTGGEQAGPPPPRMKEEYSAGPMGPSNMTVPPQGFLPPGFQDPAFGPFPPQFGYYFPQGEIDLFLSRPFVAGWCFGRAQTKDVFLGRFFTGLQMLSAKVASFLISHSPYLCEVFFSSWLYNVIGSPRSLKIGEQFLMMLGKLLMSCSEADPLFRVFETHPFFSALQAPPPVGPPLLARSRLVTRPSPPPNPKTLTRRSTSTTTTTTITTRIIMTSGIRNMGATIRCRTPRPRGLRMRQVATRHWRGAAGTRLRRAGWSRRGRWRRTWTERSTWRRGSCKGGNISEAVGISSQESVFALVECIDKSRL